MEAIIINNSKDLKIDEEKIKKAANFIFAQLEKEENSEINIVFIGKEEIKELNLKYRGKDNYTDVLSFSYLEDKDVFGFIGDSENFKNEFGFFTVGEIMICPQAALENIAKYNKKFDLEHELIFLIIHGMLHIYGYDHENDGDSEAMDIKQDELMDKVSNTI